MATETAMSVVLKSRLSRAPIDLHGETPDQLVQLESQDEILSQHVEILVGVCDLQLHCSKRILPHCVPQALHDERSLLLLGWVAAIFEREIFSNTKQI